MRSDLPVLVSEALGIEAVSARSLSGGSIGEVYSLELAGGTRVVAKVDRSATPRLDIEGYMLGYLAAHSALPVPAVLHTAPDLLVMEWRPGASHFGTAEQGHAAELLAALHDLRPPDIDGRKQYGLERATLIGPLHQPNPWRTSWLDFFREARLLHMADEALKEGCMPRDFHKRLCAFAERLDEFIAEPPHPSLLHGDVWTTNVLAEGGKVTAFIDPAIYYGHPEIELAFSTLFGTFDEAFFARYESLRPIPPGFFDVRRDIYNIYPLLVHTRIFGASYLAGIDQCLARLGF